MLDQQPMPITAARALGKLGVVCAKRVTDCSILLGWTEVNSAGLLTPSLRGQAINTMPRTEERLRGALVDMVSAVAPPWVQNARFGRRRVLQYAPPEIVQICREAGLTDVSTPDVVAFWDTLAAQARGLRSMRLNETGRTGERLTLHYEEMRTGRTPQWVALDSNEDGYDVLSSLNAEDHTPVCIEVKTSQLGLSGSFYLTRHEWEAAKSFLHYHIHLWDLSNTVSCLAILNLEDVAQHLPTDHGNGRWDVICIPFHSFSDHFTSFSLN
ncbi:protein NO VEIN domain-containing protein [Thauera sp. SDU_THAU2]|uniref:protein NO VEIN domain-containing protein n=1 Tax=Thauera sp. SDU_THAU2 TaxID=3136633 RepID=UPI0031200A57